MDHEAASREWEDIFGIPRSRDLLAFTNAQMGFIRGVGGQPDGLASITTGVEGRDEFNAILDRAREEGLCGDGWINILAHRKEALLCKFLSLVCFKNCSLWQLIRM